MLVITRKEGEELYLSLGDDVDPDLTAKELFKKPIKVMITESDGAVRVGVDAPKEIKVRRDEVWDSNKRM